MAPQTLPSHMLHSVKYALRPVDGCRQLFCVFFMLGFSLAAIGVMTLTMLCRFHGEIASLGNMDYQCRVGAGGQWFSMPMVIGLILLGCTLLALVGMTLVCLCHHANPEGHMTQSHDQKACDVEKEPLSSAGQDSLCDGGTGVA